MDDSRWENIQRLFIEALELPVSARDDYLQRECGDDLDLRCQVERLLAAEPRADALLNRMEASAGRLAWEPFQQGVCP
ncbi:MAG: hypothetical protein P8184_02450 [Calditrichia bacterium]